VTRAAIISPAVFDLPRAIDLQFAEAQDRVAEHLRDAWKGQIVAIDLIDTGTYLQAVGVEEVFESGDVRTVTISSGRASGYAAAIRRKGESDYAGQRVAEEGIRISDSEINRELERAGARLK